MLAKGLVEVRIQRYIGLVVGEQVELDVAVARTVEDGLVGVNRIRIDEVGRDALAILEGRGLSGEEGCGGFAGLRRVLGP